MGVDSLPPHGLHQLLIWSVDNYHFESQIVIWATSLLFVPETPAHFIRWAVIHLGLSVVGGNSQLGSNHKNLYSPYFHHHNDLSTNALT